MLGKLLYSKRVKGGRLKGLDLWEFVCVENFFRKRLAIDRCVWQDAGFLVVFVALKILQRKLDRVVLGRGKGYWLGFGFGGYGVWTRVSCLRMLVRAS